MCLGGFNKKQMLATVVALGVAVVLVAPPVCSCPPFSPLFACVWIGDANYT
jgi:hypothetical protein